jgi:hypothetical protein
VLTGDDQVHAFRAESLGEATTIMCMNNDGHIQDFADWAQTRGRAQLDQARIQRHVLLSPLAAAFLVCAFQGPLRTQLLVLLMNAVMSAVSINYHRLEADFATRDRLTIGNERVLGAIADNLELEDLQRSPDIVPAAAVATTDTYPGERSMRAHNDRLRTQGVLLGEIEEKIGDLWSIAAGAPATPPPSDDEELAHASDRDDSSRVEYYAQENLEEDSEILP